MPTGGTREVSLMAETRGGRRVERESTEHEVAQAENQSAFKDLFTSELRADAFDTLKNMAFGTGVSSETVKIRAMELLLAYGMGKPQISTAEAGGPELGPEALSKMAEQLRAQVLENEREWEDWHEHEAGEGASEATPDETGVAGEGLGGSEHGAGIASAGARDGGGEAKEPSA